MEHLVMRTDQFEAAGTRRRQQVGFLGRLGLVVCSFQIVCMSLTASSVMAETRSADAPNVEQANEDLARTALRLDHEGRHAEAAEIIRLLREREPANPDAALLEVENQYWHFMYDTPNIRDDEALRVSIEASMSLAKKQLAAHPNNYRARSQYGRALMDDARRLAMLGSYYGAGSRSEKARKILEEVVASRPEDTDARYQLGNYYYWSSAMPAALRAMDWLWFIPKGNRQLGLEYLGAVADSTGPHADSANMVLSVIGMYYAPADLGKSESRIRRLRGLYPNNVLIHYELLEVLFLLEKDDELLAEAASLAGRAGEPQPVRAHALMAGSWAGRVALKRGGAAEALGLFDALAAEPDRLPNWGAAWLDVMRGQAFDALGRREDALVAYQRVVAYEDEREAPRASRQAERLIEAPYNAATFRPRALVLSGD
jgi:tetratricopeptide (TPR) repeat protein